MKVKKRMLLFLMLLTISSTMALAAPTNSVLGVTRKEQVKSNWCWAATAQMLGNYYGSTKTQYQISANVKGNTTNNSAAFTSELTKAIEYATGRNCAVTGVLSFSEMKSLVGDELTPLAIYMSWGGTNGHYVVVGGYKSSGYKVYLLDPAPNCSTAYYAHYDLVNGTTIQSGTGSYMTTWIPE